MLVGVRIRACSDLRFWVSPGVILTPAPLESYNFS